MQKKHLSQYIGKAIESLMNKNGFKNIKIFHNWIDIVGSELALHCFPSKIYYSNQIDFNGTLLLLVNNPSANTYIQSMSSSLIGKINGYLGYKAIAKIKIHVVIEKRITGPTVYFPQFKAKVISQIENNNLQETLEKIDDKQIKELLCSISDNLFVKI